MSSWFYRFRLREGDNRKQAEALDATRRRDFGTARRIADELMAAGDPYGRILLARLYMDGSGVEQNLDLALKLLQEAEALGSVEASYQQTGIFARKNDQEAYFKSLRKAARAGCLPAKVGLGRCYLWGAGTPQDVPYGEKILMEAAAQGSVKARHILAYFRLRHSKGYFEFAGRLGQTILYGYWSRLIKWYDPSSRKLG
jgi:TPR repeat protein